MSAKHENGTATSASCVPRRSVVGRLEQDRVLEKEGATLRVATSASSLFARPALRAV